MKKFFTALVLFVSVISLLACKRQEDSKQADLTSYEAIDLKTVNQKIADKENFFLYVGRPTCPHCRAFSPKLEAAIRKTQMKVYYLNTDEEEDQAIADFAQKEGFSQVPELRYYQKKGQTLQLKNTSQASQKQIETFLSQ